MTRSECRCRFAAALLVNVLGATGVVTAQDPPENTSLVGRWDEYNGAYADVWGDGNYAYVGSFTLSDGNQASVHIVAVADPANPELAATYFVAPPNQFRSPQDVKVANGMMFVALESGGADIVEIVDVRDPTLPVHASFIRATGFSRCHNTFYADGFLYLADSSTPRVAIVDLTSYNLDNSPAQVNQKWIIDDVGNSFVHDVTVHNDRLYAAAWDSGLWVYNVSFVDIAVPPNIGKVGGNNTHSMWPTDDGMFVVTGEERSGGGIDLYEIIDHGNILEFIHRDSLVLTGQAFSVHNQVVVGNRLYVSWYQAGLQVFDIDPFFGELEFVGSYDTSSAGLSGFLGAWGVYPQLGSDRVMVSDMQQGLFIVDTRGPLLTFDYPDGLLEFVAPAGGTELRVQITAGEAMPDPTSGQLFARVDGGPYFAAGPLIQDGGDYVATFPEAPCGSTVDYYFSIDTLGGQTVRDPAGAPDFSHGARSGEGATVLSVFNFEATAGWTVSGTAVDGHWERGDPITSCNRGNPPSDFDGSGFCFLTDNEPAQNCDTDVDGGVTILTSPALDMTGIGEPFIEYARWFSNETGGIPGNDAFLVEISNDDDGPWLELETVGPDGDQVGGGWFRRAFRVRDFVLPTPTVRVRFIASDLGSGTIVEAALDDVRILEIPCGPMSPRKLSSSRRNGRCADHGASRLRCR